MNKLLFAIIYKGIKNIVKSNSQDQKYGRL
jgi:hypothetical protein